MDEETDRNIEKGKQKLFFADRSFVKIDVKFKFCLASLRKKHSLCNGKSGKTRASESWIVAQPAIITNERGGSVSQVVCCLVSLGRREKIISGSTLNINHVGLKVRLGCRKKEALSIKNTNF